MKTKYYEVDNKTTIEHQSGNSKSELYDINNSKQFDLNNINYSNKEKIKNKKKIFQKNVVIFYVIDYFKQKIYLQKYFI